MTYRPSDLSPKKCYSQHESRLNQYNRCEGTGEGCPVIEESGTVCGETDSLNVFKEFRLLFDDCLKKLKGDRDDCLSLAKLVPFRKLIEDLWEQNILLVETVEELEQEATCRVTNLENKLKKSCQKVTDYQEDVRSLVEVIHRFSDKGIIDFTGLKFNTLSPACICKDYIDRCTITDCSELEDDFYCNENLAIPEIRQASNILYENETENNFKMENKRQNLEFSGLKSQFKSFKNKCGRPIKSNVNECCLNENFNNFLSQRNSQSTNQFDEIICEKDSYEECVKQININLNLGNEEVQEAKSCCCCHNCSCILDTSQDNYC